MMLAKYYTYLRYYIAMIICSLFVVISSKALCATNLTARDDMLQDPIVKLTPKGISLSATEWLALSTETGREFNNLIRATNAIERINVLVRSLGRSVSTNLTVVSAKPDIFMTSRSTGSYTKSIEEFTKRVHAPQHKFSQYSEVKLLAMIEREVCRAITDRILSERDFLENYAILCYWGGYLTKGGDLIKNQVMHQRATMVYDGWPDYGDDDFYWYAREASVLMCYGGEGTRVFGKRQEELVGIFNKWFEAWNISIDKGELVKFKRIDAAVKAAGYNEVWPKLWMLLQEF
jgi:hypothetical protein